MKYKNVCMHFPAVHVNNLPCPKLQAWPKGLGAGKAVCGQVIYGRRLVTKKMVRTSHVSSSILDQEPVCSDN